MLAYLYDCGATGDVLYKAEEVMLSGMMNTGFTFTNPSIYGAVIVIGPTTSSDEFLNTLAHEVHHLAVAVAKELNVNLEGETPAYITGDSTKDLASVICKLGCGREHKADSYS